MRILERTHIHSNPVDVLDTSSVLHARTHTHAHTYTRTHIHAHTHKHTHLHRIVLTVMYIYLIVSFLLVRI